MHFNFLKSYNLQKCGTSVWLFTNITVKTLKYILVWSYVHVQANNAKNTDALSTMLLQFQVECHHFKCDVFLVLKFNF